MKDKGMKVLGLLGATTVATLIGAGEASAIVLVDSFDPAHNLNNDGQTDTIDASTSDIAGGERDVRYNEDPAKAGTPGGTKAGRQVGDDEILTLTAGDDFTNQTATVQLGYDGNDSNSDLKKTGLNADFAPSENKGLKFKIFSADSRSEISVTLFSDNGNDSVSINNFGLENTPNDNNLFFSFTDSSLGEATFGSFSGNGSYNDISAVQIELTTNNDNLNSSNSIGVEAFGATPSSDTTLEPVPFEAETSIGLALLGAWGAYKRWKNKQKAS